MLVKHGSASQGESERPVPLFEAIRQQWRGSGTTLNENDTNHGRVTRLHQTSHVEYGTFYPLASPTSYVVRYRVLLQSDALSYYSVS
jgi:hypothetical protein